MFNRKISMAVSKEQQKAYNREYYLKHRDAIRKATKQYADSNRVVVRARSRKRALETKEQNNERARAWYVANKQLMIDRAKDWKKKHPDSVRANTRDYASRRSNAIGRFTSYDYTKLLNRYKGMCAYCSSSKANSIDHVVPLSKGGTNYIGNILPVCSTCNSSKAAKNLYTWRRTSGRLLAI